MEVTRQLRKDKLTKKGYVPIQVTICWAQQRVLLNHPAPAGTVEA